MILNSKEHPPTWNKRHYLEKAAERLGIKLEDDGWILNIEPCEIKYGTQGTMLWHIDVLLNNSSENKYRQVYDRMNHIFTADLSDHPRAKLLLQAIDPVIHRRYTDIPQDVDFVISGSYGHSQGIYNQRNYLTGLLKERFTYSDEGNGKPPEEYIKGLNRAKVQFIRSMDVNGRGEIAQRFFECLAIGPVLTNWVPELEHTGLIEDTHYMAYRNDEEMLRKMKVLIDNDELRDKIAVAGRQAALLNHTYEHRLISILNTIKYG